LLAKKELKETATLVFVIRDTDDGGKEMLLINKKRGLGAGLWNAPGGHVEEGETPVQAGLREFKEETLAEADCVERVGILDFYMPDRDDFSMRVFVFRADEIIGEPMETEEALPQWFRIECLPWGDMWVDDRIWLPHVIKGRHVEGSFTMIEGNITECKVTWT